MPRTLKLPRKPPHGARVTTSRIGDREYLVVSYPVHPLVAQGPVELTPAESDVAQLVSDGLTNGEVATRRGTTVRTVAKQLERVYRKLGINSRAELVRVWLLAERSRA